MNMRDPRLTPARPDLAADHLRGEVAAPRYAAPKHGRIVASSAPLRRAPSPDAPLDTEALAGERVAVYDEQEGWAWGQLLADGYVGYLPASAIREDAPAPTHAVTVLRTFLYPGPSIKLPPLDALPLAAQVAVSEIRGDFAVVAGGGYVFAAHLAPAEIWRETDFVAVAERFLGVPYLWGGKTSLGLDCSGLVQLSFTACRIAAPRDTDLQEKAVGSPVPLDLAGLRRGDLVFWKGHVGIMTGPFHLIHANAHYMQVAVEPLAEAIARIEAKGAGRVTSVRRLG